MDTIRRILLPIMHLLRIRLHKLPPAGCRHQAIDISRQSFSFPQTALISKACRSESTMRMSNGYVLSFSVIVRDSTMTAECLHAAKWQKSSSLAWLRPGTRNDLALTTGCP
ncbi:hypothetical protein [Paraburkholderia phosphatilytica]|uniref:hypothetical protein n=1 Tax=Paraburkholderia phosphatilytica TaxID=2282883 RepID=UPI000E4CAB51|nr:hypothetical protein [Paraburkholderia phosphatilytica]